MSAPQAYAERRPWSRRGYHAVTYFWRMFRADGYSAVEALAAAQIRASEYPPAVKP